MVVHFRISLYNNYVSFKILLLLKKKKKKKKKKKVCMYLSSPIMIIIKLIILNLARANVRAIMSRYCPQDYF